MVVKEEAWAEHIHMGWKYRFSFRLGSFFASSEALAESEKALAKDIEKALGQSPFLERDNILLPPFDNISRIRNYALLELIIPRRIESYSDGFHPAFQTNISYFGKQICHLENVYWGDDSQACIDSLRQDPCYHPDLFFLAEHVWYDHGLTYSNKMFGP